MQKCTDGRVVLTKREADALGRVLEYSLQVVDTLEAEKNLEEDYCEVRLFSALETCAQLGLTVESLKSGG